MPLTISSANPCATIASTSASQAAACGPVATWEIYAAKAAEQIASAISDREFATGLKLDMTKGA